MTKSALRPVVIAVLTPAAEDSESFSIVSNLYEDGDLASAVDAGGEYITEQEYDANIHPAALEWWHLGPGGLASVPICEIRALYAKNDPGCTGDVVGIWADYSAYLSGEYEPEFADVRRIIDAACDEFTVIRTAQLLGTFLGPGQVTLPKEAQ